MNHRDEVGLNGRANLTGKMDERGGRRLERG